MRQASNITRLTLYIALSATLIFSVAFLLLNAMVKIHAEYGWQLVFTWAGFTIVFIIVGTALFGLIALLINRVNPFESRGRYFIMPLFFFAAAFFGHELYKRFFRSYWLTLEESSPVIMVCLVLCFVYMSIKMYRMLGYNSYNQ
jgi:ABC-type transport system involved in multi-copper enzyme maturation permease subunit